MLIDSIEPAVWRLSTVCATTPSAEDDQHERAQEFREHLATHAALVVIRAAHLLVR